jgi:nitrite reductase/ring-hydroxylating ferredoxin subunit
VNEQEIAVGRFDELENPGCREFQIGEGDWPFRGFVVRKGGDVFAYQNFCVHVDERQDGTHLRVARRDLRNRDGLLFCRPRERARPEEG